MTRPVGNIPTTNVDGVGDSPASAIAQLQSLIDQFNEAVQAFGAADGIATLDADGKVPDQQIGRGVAGGVASLNDQGKIPVGLLPAAEVAGGLSTQVTESGYTGSGDRYVADATLNFVTTSSGTKLNIVITYAQVT